MKDESTTDKDATQTEKKELHGVAGMQAVLKPDGNIEIVGLASKDGFIRDFTLLDARQVGMQLLVESFSNNIAAHVVKAIEGMIQEEVTKRAIMITKHNMKGRVN